MQRLLLLLKLFSVIQDPTLVTTTATSCLVIFLSNLAVALQLTLSPAQFSLASRSNLTRQQVPFLVFPTLVDVPLIFFFFPSSLNFTERKIRSDSSGLQFLGRGDGGDLQICRDMNLKKGRVVPGLFSTQCNCFCPAHILSVLQKKMKTSQECPVQLTLRLSVTNSQCLDFDFSIYQENLINLYRFCH